MKSKQQKRSEALARFTVLSQEKWNERQMKRGLIADAMGYKAYIHRKKTEELNTVKKGN